MNKMEDTVARYLGSLDQRNIDFEPFRSFMTKQTKQRQREIVEALTHYGLMTASPQWLMFSFVINAALDLEKARGGIETAVEDNTRTITGLLSAYPNAAKSIHEDVTALATSIKAAQEAYVDATNKIEAAKTRLEREANEKAKTEADARAAEALHTRSRRDMLTFVFALAAALCIWAVAAFSAYGFGDRNGEMRGLYSSHIDAREAKEVALGHALQQAQKRHLKQAEALVLEEIARTRR